MLHDGDQHFIAGPERVPPPALGHEIDGLGCARVNTISDELAAPRKPATFSRAAW
jgi:hypothetical protein